MNFFPAIGLLLLLVSGPSLAAIWETKHQWNGQWEARYSEWVEREYVPTFFTQGKYADIPHDCADSAYFARLVFAYENKLPFVIKDPRYPIRDKLIAANREMFNQNAGKSPYATIKEMISNEFTYYDDLPPEERFSRFLRFVGDVVGTNSLMEDTYPVRLTQQWFRPGVVAALPRLESNMSATFFQEGANGAETPESAGHAQVVTKVDQDGVIHYLKSTVPAKVQEFKHTTLNSFVPGPKGGSFRYWKQPQHYAMSEASLPGYGTEQFELKGVFEDEMQKRLAQVQEASSSRFERLAQEVCQQIEQRVPVISEGWAYKQRIGARCMDFKEFDAYSTPSRDSKIIKALRYLIRTATGSEQGDMAQVSASLDEACGAIEYLPGKRINASRFAKRLMDGAISSDPNQSPAVRWGDQEPERLGCKQFY